MKLRRTRVESTRRRDFKCRKASVSASAYPQRMGHWLVEPSSHHFPELDGGRSFHQPSRGHTRLADTSMTRDSLYYLFALVCAVILLGWLWRHESGTYLRFTD